VITLESRPANRVLKKVLEEKYREIRAHLFILILQTNQPHKTLQNLRGVNSKLLKFPLLRCSCRKRDEYQDHRKE